MNPKIKGKSFRHLYYSKCIMPINLFLSNRLNLNLPVSNCNYISRILSLSSIPLNYRIFCYKYTNNVLMFAEREANAFPDRQINTSCRGCLSTNTLPAMSEKNEHIFYYCSGTKILRDRMGEVILNRNLEPVEISIGYNDSTQTKNLAINCLILLLHKFVYDNRKCTNNLTNLNVFKDWMLSNIRNMCISNRLLLDICLSLIEAL